ncbi:MAG: hypothetical protein AAF798_08005 [Bacteroidota bacterium]
MKPKIHRLVLVFISVIGLLVACKSKKQLADIPEPAASTRIVAEASRTSDKIVLESQLFVVSKEVADTLLVPQRRPLEVVTGLEQRLLLKITAPFLQDTALDEAVKLMFLPETVELPPYLDWESPGDLMLTDEGITLLFQINADAISALSKDTIKMKFLQEGSMLDTEVELMPLTQRVVVAPGHVTLSGSVVVENVANYPIEELVVFVEEEETGKLLEMKSFKNDTFSLTLRSGKSYAISFDTEYASVADYFFRAKEKQTEVIIELIRKDGFVDNRDSIVVLPPNKNQGTTDSEKTTAKDEKDRLSPNCEFLPIGDASSEEALWEQIAKDPNYILLQLYLERFPNGKYSEAARRQLAESDYEGMLESITGKLLYYIPDTMLIREVYKVGMAISGDTTQATQNEIIRDYQLFGENRPKVRAEIIQIGEVMRANLTDPRPDDDKAFAVQAIGEDNRRSVNLLGGIPDIWEWSVTPLKAGQYKLFFTIEIILEKGEEKIPEVIPVKDAEILVVIEPTFFQQYGLPIGGGILGLLGFLLFLIFRKRKKQQQALQLTLPTKELFTHIRENETAEALDLLAKALAGQHADYESEVLLLQSRFEQNEEDARKGIVSNAERTLERNRINNSLLELIQKIRKG